MILLLMLLNVTFNNSAISLIFFLFLGGVREEERGQEVEEDERAQEIDEEEPPPKRTKHPGRKGTRRPATWKRTKSSNLRNLGQE